jgi:hypothetical protein
MIEERAVCDITPDMPIEGDFFLLHAINRRCFGVVKEERWDFK